MHRLTSLLYADDPALVRQGCDELKAAFKTAESVADAAKSLGVSVRSVIRWAEKAGIPTPDGRGNGVPEPELRAAIRKAKSAVGAAKLLGISHTTVLRLAVAAGIEVPDGRATRHRNDA
jgi:molybdenum-dependent DNA-binding transcriptional regulator ModE